MVSESDQYREKWAYIRHTERLRFQLIYGLLFVTGVVVSFVVQRLGNTESWEEDVDPLAVGALITLLVLFVAGHIFVLQQKRAYDWYVGQLRELDGRPAPWENQERGEAGRWWALGLDLAVRGSFRALNLGLLLLGTAVASFAGLVIWFPWGLFSFVVYLAAAAYLSNRLLSR